MKKFKKAYIEITNICNLDCSFCHKTKRVQRMLALDEFEIIANEVKKYTDFIYLHLLGEPLIHPQLDEILKISTEIGLKVNITTNGTLIKKVSDVLLKNNIRKVSFSVHSFEASTQHISLNEYLDDIIEFCEVAEQHKIICQIRLWNLTEDKNMAQNTLNAQILNRLNIKHIDKNIKLSDYLYVNVSKKFIWPDINLPIVSENIFCYGLRDQFGVLCDGTVVPCCLDSEGNMPLGNILKTPLDNILKSKEALNIYDGFSRRKATTELCKRCDYATRL